MEEPLESPLMKPQPKMPLGKVALINFGILLATTLLSLLMTGDESLALFGVVMLLQSAINFIVGLVFLFQPARMKLGQAMVICSILVPIVGFGLCVLRISNESFNFH